jgi:hypothetical protein
LLQIHKVRKTIPDTLNYDIVNVGRELLAQLSSAAVLNITAAVKGANREDALAAGAHA